MKDLITRLEQATGGSRELDAEIAEAIHPDRSLLGKFERAASRPVNEWGKAGWNTDGVPAYTKSMDAAMSLIPEGCLAWSVGDSIGGGWARVFVSGDEVPGIAKTPALALCVACLRAMDGGE